MNQSPQNPYQNIIGSPNQNNSDLQQQVHQFVTDNKQLGNLGNPMVVSVPGAPQVGNSKIDEYKYHQQKNKDDLTSSVMNLSGFYKEQMDGYTFDYRQSDHPVAALFHFGIKAFALAIYVFGGWFIREAWTIPEIIIVLGAIDFWITKNVTGRLLVGLRWWEEIDEATEEQIWVFETRVNENLNSKVNEGIFWITMVMSVLAWGFLGAINILGLNIFNMIGIGFQFLIQSINLYFYFQCSRIAKQRTKQLAKVLGAEILNKMMNQSVIWPLKIPKQK